MLKVDDERHCRHFGILKSAQPIGTESEAFLSPAKLAERWSFCSESIRRMLRQGRMASLVLARLGKNEEARKQYA